MKATIYILAGFLFVCCSTEPLNFDNESQHIDVKGMVTFYKNEPYSGEGVTYFDNGLLESRISFKDGLPYGTWEFYYENGNLKKTEDWINGLKGGQFRRYFINGQLQYDMFFVADKAHGTFKYYDEKGELLKTELWQEGTLISKN